MQSTTNNFRFYFDYIYYRITKFYFKWDGRTGATGLISVVMIQSLVIIDIGVSILRLFKTREETTVYLPYGKWIIIFLFLVLLIYNYRKYNGKYNVFRFHWKDEPGKTYLLKGLLVILSLILPWIPLILMGIRK